MDWIQGGFFLRYFLILHLLFFCGWLFFKPFKRHEKFSISLCFFYLTTGFYLVTLIYSLFRSGGGSISSLLILIFMLTAKHYNVREVENEGTFRNTYLCFLLLAGLSFFYFCVLHHYTKSFPTGGDNRDGFFYAALSEHLKLAAQENRYAVLNHTAVQGLSPYHYFDLWFNALMSQAFSVPAFDALYLITYPVLCTVTLSGMYLLGKTFISSNQWILLVVPPLLFLSALVPVREINYHFATAAAESPLEPLGVKYLVYYPLIIFSFDVLVKSQNFNGYLLLLPLIVISASTVPGFALFFVGLVLFKICNKAHDWISFATKILLVFVSFFAFYFFCGSDTGTEGVENIWQHSYFEEHASTKNKLAALAEGFLENLWYFVACYFPACLMAIVIRFRKEFSQLRILLPLFWLPVCGAFAFVLFVHLDNNYQLLTNLLPVLHVVGFIFVFRVFQLCDNLHQKLTVLGLLLVNLAVVLFFQV